MKLFFRLLGCLVVVIAITFSHSMAWANDTTDPVTAREIRQETIAALIEALSDSDPEVVADVALTLDAYGAEAATATARLKDTIKWLPGGWELGNGTYQHRYQAAKALLAIAPEDNDLPVLLDGLLDDKVYVVRGHGAVVMAALGPRATSSEPKLRELMSSRDRKVVRSAAAVVLLTLNPADGEALEFVKKTLALNDWHSQYYIGLALQRAPELASLLKAETFDRGYRYNEANYELRRALVAMGDGIVPYLFEQLDSKRGGFAANLLVQIARRSPDVRARFPEILERVDRSMWVAIATGLEDGPDFHPEELDLLHSILELEDKRTFSTALFTLARLGAVDAKSLDYIRKGLTHKEHDVRKATLEAIAILGWRAAELKDDVSPLLNDKKKKVSRAATIAHRILSGQPDLKMISNLRHLQYHVVPLDRRYELYGLGPVMAKLIDAELRQSDLKKGKAINALLAVRFVSHNRAPYARAILPYLKHDDATVRKLAAQALRSFAAEPVGFR